MSCLETTNSLPALGSWDESMTTKAELPMEERIFRLLQHLGLKQAHFAACAPIDWEGIATKYSYLFSSLTLVCPQAISPNVLEAMASRLLLVAGDQGRSDEVAKGAVTNLPEAKLVSLNDYLAVLWSDVIADRTHEVGSAMTNFMK